MTENKKHRFHLLKTIRSKELNEQNLKKLSLNADTKGRHLHAFLWVNQNEELDRGQLLFDEKLIEWSISEGVTTSVSNRYQESGADVGVRKGTRTMQKVQNFKILDEGLQLIQDSVFPIGLGMVLEKAFLSDYTPTTKNEKEEIEEIEINSTKLDLADLDELEAEAQKQNPT